MKIIKEQAETYAELEHALSEGTVVQICTISQSGRAVDWQDVDEINKAFAPNRYRTIER